MGKHRGNMRERKLLPFFTFSLFRISRDTGNPSFTPTSLATYKIIEVLFFFSPY